MATVGVKGLMTCSAKEFVFFCCFVFVGVLYAQKVIDVGKLK